MPRPAVLAVLFLITGTAACKSHLDDTPAEPVIPIDLQLVSAGNEPRTLLRYHPAQGTTHKLQLAVAAKLEADQASGPIPEIAIDMTLVVDTLVPATGQVKLRATVDGVSARDAPGSKVPSAALAKPLEAIKGVVIQTMLSPNGRVTAARVDSTGVPGPLHGNLASLVASFQQTMMPLPDDPVGVGAVWRTSRPLAQNGLTLSAVSTVTLTAIAGDRISYVIESDVHGPDQQVAQEGISLDVTNVVGTSAGKGTVDLASLAVTSELTAELRSDMKTGGDAAPTKMRMTTKVTVAPRP